MTITVTPVANTQTFGAWLSTTNRLANLMSQNTVTSDSSNGGSITTGNSFVNGHFGAEFVYVANTLIGGNVSSNGVLRIQANLAVTNGTSNLFTITANSTVFNISATGNTVEVIPTGNVTIGGNTLVVNTANVLFSGANIQFTNAPLTGNITFNSNTIYNGSVIIANGSFGSNSSALYSNGTGMYWRQLPNIVGNSGIIANADGIFVNANNGLIANSSGVFVVQGTGTVVNSSGVFVNSAYIATLDANTAAFANASSTNTFTVGTATYFVANGNVGIGTSTPNTLLTVNGDITTADKIIHLGDSDTSIRFAANDTISIETAGVERLRVLANGNIGIGNSTPTSLLQVDGNINANNIKLNSSGGGSITLAATNTASNFTATFPANTGIVVTTGSSAVVTQGMLAVNVAGNGPTFGAYLSTNQNVTTNVLTKVQINTEEFDTNSNYDNSTNYRFTPTVAGYYQIDATVIIIATALTVAFSTIYKNGSEFKRGGQISYSSGNASVFGSSVSALIYFNGSTDYVELYAQGTGTSPYFLGGQQYTWFSGTLVRAA